MGILGVGMRSTPREQRVTHQSWMTRRMSWLGTRVIVAERRVGDGEGGAASFQPHLDALMVVRDTRRRLGQLAERTPMNEVEG